MGISQGQKFYDPFVSADTKWYFLRLETIRKWKIMKRYRGQVSGWRGGSRRCSFARTLCRECMVQWRSHSGGCDSIVSKCEGISTHWLQWWSRSTFFSFEFIYSFERLASTRSRLTNHSCSSFNNTVNHGHWRSDISAGTPSYEFSRFLGMRICVISKMGYV